MEDGWYKFTTDIFRKIMKTYTYPYREMLELELSGQEVISTLLNKFIPAVLYWDTDAEEERMSKVEKNFLYYIPEKYREDYLAARTGDPAFDLYLRFFMVVDYISSMTDSDAKATYQALGGF